MTPSQLLSSSDWLALKADEKFRRYLEALGLPDYNKTSRIKRILERDYPKEWEELRVAVDRRTNRESHDDVYAIKNRNLPFSLFATIENRGELHAKIFSRIDGISDTVSSILDIGCENGFFTCLLALRWPNAKVIGIDPSEPALNRARELAAKLNLKNISFTASSAENADKIVCDEKFDLITTVTVLNNGALFPPDQCRPTRTPDFFNACSIGPVPPAFSAISNVLMPEKGRWIAVEFCQSPSLFSIWCQALDCAGLGIDWVESDRVAYREKENFFTMLVAGHDRPRPLDLDKAHGFWISPEFNRWTLPNEPAWTICNQQAEAIFARLSPKTCIDRIIASDASGKEIHRIEVWEAGTLALFYTASHSEERTRLQLRAITDLTSMRGHWKSSVGAMRKDAPSWAHLEEFHSTT